MIFMKPYKWWAYYFCNFCAKKIFIMLLLAHWPRPKTTPVLKGVKYAGVLTEVWGAVTAIMQTSASVLEELQSLWGTPLAASKPDPVGQSSAGCQVKGTKDGDVLEDMCVLGKLLELVFSVKHTPKEHSMQPIISVWHKSLSFKYYNRRFR